MVPSVNDPTDQEDAMPIIYVDWVERSTDQKKEVARRLTDDMVEVTGCSPEAVTVIFNEHPKTQIAKAGTLLSEK
jgi:4-oxalocrotonate tautomerase